MRRLAHTDYPVVALTHPGMKGKNNEDSFGVTAFSQGLWGPRPILLAVLSDGIGGHRAGEVASRIAVDVISQAVQRSNGSNPPAALRDAIVQASEAIRIQAGQSSEQAGMGATCACAWIQGDQLYTASVGDSRLYLLRGEQIQQLSTDHTWLQEALEHGLITAEQIPGHPNQHVIRRYLGSPTPPEVDLRLRNGSEEEDRSEANQGLNVLPGDLLLLTSDGLTDLVSDEEISQCYRDNPAEAAGRALIDLANSRGGHDNITIVAVQVPLHPRTRRAVPANWRWAGVGCGAILAAAALALSLAGGWWWIQAHATPMPTQTPLVSATSQPQQVVPGAPSATPTAPQVTLSAFRTPTATVVVKLPLDSGPTLTPWPTNTVVK
jgi:PPM family protein phosphatase